MFRVHVLLLSAATCYCDAGCAVVQLFYSSCDVIVNGARHCVLVLQVADQLLVQARQRSTKRGEQRHQLLRFLRVVTHDISKLRRHLHESEDVSLSECRRVELLCMGSYLSCVSKALQAQ